MSCFLKLVGNGSGEFNALGNETVVAEVPPTLFEAPLFLGLRRVGGRDGFLALCWVILSSTGFKF